ncbi:Gfo/Idh/MocA family protein [Paenibacillus allorhizosphaerae]|uniref:Glycosyl hydrolase family 109 protein 1 n=1 Tax=Paenibacillus allorhizosphaerae TaxID=2849866 RepID=A0ABM8VQM4_9BACL|nr:Gfo/Idh/MocA family oxidoreductase [Paenibacillus allorhizosphaerae]CAG7654398.1 Glycosyl hydrolase family 109 protein 1 [Paenibacillus allorhizosphaerae]
MQIGNNNAVIRIGIVGYKRGQSFQKSPDVLGFKLVAVCDQDADRLKNVQAMEGVATYTEYDKFLEHDMDAVILANYFHQHAPFAIKALRAGKHVLSETTACKTIQEGVELIRTVEQTGKVYLLAENYAYIRYNQEMKRLYQNGTIGEVRYAIGEYNHTFSKDQALGVAPGPDHWRNHIASTHYSTHAIAPLMYITDTMPVKVNALSIADPDQEHHSVRRGDPGSVILMRMNNGAVFQIFGKNLSGGGTYYRLHGTRGMMENVRKSPQQLVHVSHAPWELQPGESEDMVYTPEYPFHAEIAKNAGHGGGDFWTMYYFGEAIRSGEQPYLNVYRGVAMSIVGILAWKSALEDGAPYDVPDLSKEEVRKLHERDDWSPWPEDRRPGQPFPSIRGEIKPTDEMVAYANRYWAEKGIKVNFNSLP